jgi:glyoxylase-like metal-dependent hydrolase (beta-lactamase superfamily II)
MMGEEWPPHRAFASHVVDEGDEVALGGLDFRVESVGPAESDADSIWRLDTGDVFVGDIAYNDHHAYLADGNWRDWLVALERLERELAGATSIHVGHGDSTDATAFARQRRYVETFVEAVAAHRDAVRAGDHGPVLSAMADAGLVAHDNLLFLIDLSIEPVAAALDGETA